MIRWLIGWLGRGAKAAIAGMFVGKEVLERKRASPPKSSSKSPAITTPVDSPPPSG